MLVEWLPLDNRARQQVTFSFNSAFHLSHSPLSTQLDGNNMTLEREVTCCVLDHPKAIIPVPNPVPNDFCGMFSSDR